MAEPDEIVIRFEADGSFEAVYDDALADVLPAIGPCVTVRASHVEPAGAGWTAAMVDGPVLGPFALRAEALAAERGWLRANRGI